MGTTTGGRRSSFRAARTEATRGRSHCGVGASAEFNLKNGACGREGVIPLRIVYVLCGRVLAKQSYVSENVTDFHLE